MASEKKELLRWMAEYRRLTGIKEVDHHELAEWLKKRGWPMPEPADPIDLLAKRCSEVARSDTRRDDATGFDYRTNQAFDVPIGNGKSKTFWVDTDEADRRQMLRATTQKREQMVGEALRLANDVDHWNRINPDKQPIQLELDFTPDVEWRRNSGPDDRDKKAS